MAIRKLTKDMNVISALPDEPNDEGGLSAEQLKAKFDEAGNTMRAYINDSLVPDLDAEITAQLSEIMTTGGNLPTNGTAGQVLMKKSAAKFDVEFVDLSNSATDVVLSQAAAAQLGSAANVEAGLLSIAQTAASALRSDKLKFGTFTASTANNSTATALTVNLGGTPKALLLTSQSSTATDGMQAMAISLPLNTYCSVSLGNQSSASYYAMVRFTATGFNAYNTVATGRLNGTINYLAIMP